MVADGGVGMAVISSLSEGTNQNLKFSSLSFIFFPWGQLFVPLGAFPSNDVLQQVVLGCPLVAYRHISLTALCGLYFFTN